MLCWQSLTVCFLFPYMEKPMLKTPSGVKTRWNWCIFLPVPAVEMRDSSSAILAFFAHVALLPVTIRWKLFSLHNQLITARGASNLPQTNALGSVRPNVRPRLARRKGCQARMQVITCS